MVAADGGFSARWGARTVIIVGRVANLYLPPGGRYFGSREAYGLTYTSCQESGKFSGLYRRLAVDMGADEPTIRRALKGS